MNIREVKKENGIVLYEIKTDSYELTLCNIGASVFDLKTFDKNNNLESVVLKVAEPNDLFENNDGWFGVTVGRNAGRIKDGKFSLNSKEYNLIKNNLGNNLHSGDLGLSRRIMDSQKLDNSVEFSINIFSKDDGFPGDINIKVAYEFNEGSYKINYSALSTEDTICNLTNHTYFNLSGNLKRDIKTHKLDFNDLISYWDLDDTNVPIKETKCEFNSIESFVAAYADKPQAGMDHPFKTKDNSIFLKDEESGRELRVTSSYSHAVLYTQNFVTKALGEKLNQGLAIEFQHMPNDINMNGKNSKTILRKGKEYKQWTKYIFSL